MIFRQHLRASVLATCAGLLLPAVGRPCTFSTPLIKGASSFKVKVVDYRHRPMEGADIVLRRGEEELTRFKSDAHGEVLLGALAPGLYDLSLDQDVVTYFTQGYALEVTKESKGVKDLTFNWPAQYVVPTRALSGSLHYWETDHGANGIETSLKRSRGEGKTFALARAQLALFRLGSKEKVAETSTDDEGRFAFLAAEPGLYYMRFKFESYEETVLLDLDPDFVQSAPFIDVLIEDFIICGKAPQYRSLWPSPISKAVPFQSKSWEQQI